MAGVSTAARFERKTPQTKRAPEATQARLKRLMDPARGRNKALALKFVKVLLGAAVAAAVVEMLLPPDLPPEVKSLELGPMISMDLLSAIESRQPAQLVYTQQQVNDYLGVSDPAFEQSCQRRLLPDQAALLTVRTKGRARSVRPITVLA